MFVSDAKKALPHLFGSLMQTLINADGGWGSEALGLSLQRLYEARMWASQLNGGVEGLQCDRPNQKREGP